MCMKRTFSVLLGWTFCFAFLSGSRILCAFLGGLEEFVYLQIFKGGHPSANPCSHVVNVSHARDL